MQHAGYRRGTNNENDIRFRADDLGSKSPGDIVIPGSPAIVEVNVFPLDPSTSSKLLAKSSQTCLLFPVAFGYIAQHADPPNPARLLRTRNDRPDRRSHDTTHEIPTVYFQ